VRHAHQTVVIGGADPRTADLLKIGLGAPTAECRCVVIDGGGVAIYVADIIYPSNVIKLHIDLFANSRRPRAASKARRQAPGAVRDRTDRLRRRSSS
jgi:GntR family transcriptional regulator